VRRQTSIPSLASAGRYISKGACRPERCISWMSRGRPEEWSGCIWEINPALIISWSMPIRIRDELHPSPISKRYPLPPTSKKRLELDRWGTGRPEAEPKIVILNLPSPWPSTTRVCRSDHHYCPIQCRHLPRGKPISFSSLNFTICGDRNSRTWIYFPPP